MTKKNKHCPDCNKLIWNISPRCISCTRKRFFEQNPDFYKKENHPRWKGGKPKCLACKKEIWYGSKRCLSCSRKGKLNWYYGKCSFSSKKFKYANQKFRSSWEANFAKWLDLSGIKWKYESKVFDLGNTTYTPDFYLPEFDCYIEIKGYCRKDAKYKFKKFKKKYPKFNMKLFDKNQLFRLGLLK